jgi:hypothetical protein
MDEVNLSVDEIVALASGLKDAGCKRAVVGRIEFEFLPTLVQHTPFPAQEDTESDPRAEERDLYWSTGQ